MKRNNENESGAATYEEKEMVKGNVWDEERINEFVRHAATVDKFQIEVGKMAQKKATDESIGIYGKLIHDDHTQALQTLKSIAQNKGFSIPDTLSDEQQRKIMNLETQDGTAFNRQFLEMMVESHRVDIELWDHALTSIPDSNKIKTYVDNSLPSLRRHLQKAQQLQYQQTLDDEDTPPEAN